MKLPASQYVDFMATSIQNTLNDETLFPTKAGKGRCFYGVCVVERKDLI